MSSFTTPLIFQEISEQRWRIEEPFIYWVGARHTGIPVFVPEGFITDGASVPRPLWAIFPPVGAKYSKAAVVHDFLYATERFSRRKCDNIFLEAMEILGVAWWRRYSMYWAVRWGGGLVWDRHDPDAVQGLDHSALEAELLYFEKRRKDNAVPSSY